MTDNKAEKEQKARFNSLKREANELYDALSGRRKILMWTYPKEKLGVNWNLQDLWDRTAAAQTLGWDVIIESSVEGIKVYYAAKLPSIRPSSFW